VKSKKIQRIQVAAVTLLVIAGLINYLDRSTLSIANKAISSEMNLSASQMGLLLSAFSLPYAFAQLPIGVMLDRFGARVMLGAGMLLWSVAQAGAGLVQTLNQFILARLALGVGEGPQFPAGAKVLGDWFAIHERGRPTGIFVASSTIAPALAAACPDGPDARLWLARHVSDHGVSGHCRRPGLVLDLSRPPRCRTGAVRSRLSLRSPTVQKTKTTR